MNSNSEFLILKKLKFNKRPKLQNGDGAHLRLMDFWCLFLSFVCFCAEVGGAELIAWSAHFPTIHLYFLDRGSPNEQRKLTMTRAFSGRQTLNNYLVYCYPFNQRE